MANATTSGGQLGGGQEQHTDREEQRTDHLGQDLPAGQHLLDGDDRGDDGHPHEAAHDAGSEQDQHQGPAAAEAVDAVGQPGGQGADLAAGRAGSAA
jgi:hypothetical protein